MMLVVYKI